MFQFEHAILPKHTHDEFAREEFCGSMRRFWTQTLWPGNDILYRGKQLPSFEARHGREPVNRREVKELMEETFYYRCTNLLGRVAQEQLWDTVSESVDRQLTDLIEQARPKVDALGTIELDPDLAIPKYIEAVDIHVMPGNWQTEYCEDDVYQGALYDRAVYYFYFGSMGAQADSIGVSMARYLQEDFPDFSPKKIIDLGCTIGHSTLPWKTMYPDAEVYGVDIGAPMIRYAHARAESLGVKIHFSQQDARHTNFHDGTFDLVVHSLVTHEMPVKSVQALFAECYRLLAPGGMMVMDGGKRAKLEPDRDLFFSWFRNNNNEPFAGTPQRLDFEKCLLDLGFQDVVYSGLRGAGYPKSMDMRQAGNGKQQPTGIGSAYTVAVK